MYVEAHQELREHPKTKRLARTLKISRAQAIGHLFMLWWWAQDYAKDGDLSGLEDADIAEAADWEDDPAQFVSVLQSTGWLDPDRQLHDWWDYGGKCFVKSAKEAKKQRDWREAQKAKAAKSAPDTEDKNDIEKEIRERGNDDVTVTSGNVTVTEDNVTVSLDPDFGKVCRAYSDNCGMLSPTISDALKERLLLDSADDIAEAFALAAKRGKRSMAYTWGILDNWRREGKDNGNGKPNRNGHGKRAGGLAVRAASEADGRFDASGVWQPA